MLLVFRASSGVFGGTAKGLVRASRLVYMLRPRPSFVDFASRAASWGVIAASPGTRRLPLSESRRAMFSVSVAGLAGELRLEADP